MSSTLEASVFMGKNYSENLHSIKNTGKDLTSKQMFDMSEHLIVEQPDEIFGVSQISWEDSPWKQLSLVNDQEIPSLSHAKVYCIFGLCVISWKGESEPIIKFCLGRKRSWSKDSPQYRTLDRIDGEPMEFEWNIFPGFTTLQLVDEVQRFINKMGDPSAIPRTNYLHVDVSMTSYEELKTMNRNVLLTPHMSLFAKRFSAGR